MGLIILQLKSDSKLFQHIMGLCYDCITSVYMILINNFWKSFQSEN